MAATIGPLTLTGVAHGGWCVARHEGRVVFVSGTLPGEVVYAEVQEQRSKLWFAHTTQVVEASPDRVPHIWQLAADSGVGGADLGHVALPAQRRWKAEVIAGQLRRIAHLDQEVTVQATPGDDDSGGLAWRTRLELTADPEGRLAMSQAWTNHLIPLDSMPLAHQDIQDLAPWTERYRPGSRLSLVRPSLGDLVCLTRPTSGGPPRTIRDTHGWGKQPAGRDTSPRRSSTPPVKSIPRPASSHPLDRPSSDWIKEQVRLADGRELVYELDPLGFWQVHHQAPAVLVAAVLAALGDVEDQTVFDLYAGAGLFSRVLAEAVGEAGEVWAVEADGLACDAARRNLAGWPGRVIQGDARRVLADPASALPLLADSVVLDPPRSGAGRDVVELVAACDPGQVVYVACDPAALARDLAIFATQGYVLRQLAAYDLFPHTHHVETVAWLTR